MCGSFNSQRGKATPPSLQPHIFCFKTSLTETAHKCQIHSHCISKLEPCQKLSDQDLQGGSQKGMREKRRRRPGPCRRGRSEAWLQFQLSQRAKLSPDHCSTSQFQLTYPTVIPTFIITEQLWLPS